MSEEQVDAFPDSDTQGLVSEPLVKTGHVTRYVKSKDFGQALEDILHSNEFALDHSEKAVWEVTVKRVNNEHSK